jgi:tRNA modification GTPase
MDANDTIVAVSTPVGTGGIGIVRLSGLRAVQIADALFVGSIRPMQAPTKSLLYGKVVEDGEELDEVLLSVMRAPHSYTTEDVVEINGHGGMWMPHFEKGRGSPNPENLPGVPSSADGLISHRRKP